MREFVTFLVRHPAYATKNARKMNGVRKAMRDHRRRHPRCAYSGTDRALHIHHVVPVSIAPERVADPTNFMTLNADVHRWLGHGGNWKNFVPNIRDVVALARLQRTVPSPD